jgi:hypothetical protein
MAALRHKGDTEIGAFIRTQAGNIMSPESDDARAWNERAGDRPQGGRFSGPVCTNERNDFSFFNMNRDVPTGRRLAVRQFEPFGCK